MSFDLIGLDIPTLLVFAGLATLSVLALTVAVFKLRQFARLGVGRGRQADQIVSAWLSGRPDEAIRSASRRDTVLARVLQAVFTAQQARPDDTAYAEELGRQAALVELSTLAHRMRMLETVVQSAPMLGLLGTVIGMIEAFGALAVTEGAVNPTLLAGGIFTALTTTAAGLAIALVTYFFTNWLEGRIEGERQSIETLISAAIHGRVDPAAAT